jgi:F0F1-type ATP synthase assembly protein I
LKETNKQLLKATWGYSYIGIFFGVAIVMGYFGGRWLDKRWHTDPWLSIAGLLVGVAAGFRELYRVSKQYKREQREND